MKTKILGILAGVVTALILTACGGGEGGVEVGAFPAITATEGDAAITLKAPTSKSPAAFVFTSSDPRVATVDGTTLTVLVAGTSTITASQPSVGSYNSTSTNTTLTVKARVCAAPTVNQNGVCVTPTVCIAPATNQIGVCVAPAFTGTFVTQNGVRWMPVVRVDTWANASSFCTNTTIDGVKGWKLPTQFDLTELYASAAMDGHGWILGPTWSSTGDDVAHTHIPVNLSTGVVGTATADGTGAYFTCVR
ncbi:MAG: hypothetical protein V4631_21550 [Pseudomonadota bacterium]